MNEAPVIAEAAFRAIRGADTAWVIVATALVLLMTPALGFFYGGLVRRRNALNTLVLPQGASAAVERVENAA